MNVNLKFVAEKNTLKILAFSNNKIICEYLFVSSKNPNSIGTDLIKTTLLSWATIDLCLCNCLKISVDLRNSEYLYIKNNYKLCTKVYSKVHSIALAELVFNGQIKDNEINKFNLNRNSCYLGYSHGKDSTLCKLLLELAQYNINYYKVSYDDDTPSEDGHIYQNIINSQDYKLCSISGLKDLSNRISCHQADDIHVTFAAAYFPELSIYPQKLAVGIPWDAIHKFDDNTPDLVPTETYPSILLFQKLLQSYGFENIKVVSPIASLHTFTVYTILNEIMGFNELAQLDSCWESYLYDKACGYCPKCQRLKHIFQKCFNIEYLPEIPTLRIESADFLYGSIFAYQAVQKYSKLKWERSVIQDKYSISFSGEFVDILLRNFNLNIINADDLNIEYIQDEQTWDDLLSQIKQFIHIDYSTLLDEKKNNVTYFLPFEKYYKWNRNNPVLSCYDRVNFFNINKKEWDELIMSTGNKILQLPDSAMFNALLSNIKSKIENK